MKLSHGRRMKRHHQKTCKNWIISLIFLFLLWKYHLCYVVDQHRSLSDAFTYSNVAATTSKKEEKRAKKVIILLQSLCHISVIQLWCWRGFFCRNIWLCVYSPLSFSQLGPRRSSLCKFLSLKLKRVEQQQQQLEKIALIINEI